MLAGKTERWKKPIALALIMVLCLTMSACRVSPKLARYEEPQIEGTGQDEEGQEQGMEDPEPDDALTFEMPEEPDIQSIGEGFTIGLTDPMQFVIPEDLIIPAPPEPEQNGDPENRTYTGTAVGGTGSSGGGQGGPGQDTGIAGSSADGNISRYKTIIDANGAAVELPMKVESLTATGAAAQMAEMLGGPGKLIGADNSLLRSSLANVLFSDAGSIGNWWTGNGSSSISEANFAKLLEAKPDVCVQMSGQGTFTSDQIARLSAVGIPLVVLPAPDSVESLKQGVTLMGQMMDDTGNGTGAVAVAKRYCDWVDGVVSEVNEKTGGIEMSAIYIAGWDDSATYTLTNTKGVIPATGSGLAYAYSPNKSELITSFMKAANVINESTRYTDHFNDSEYAYVTPMFHQLGATVNGTVATYYSGAGYYDEAFDPFLTAEMTGSEGFAYQLGSAFYPSVIVNDTTTLAKIQSSLFWQYRESDETGLTDINGQSFQNSIAGLYNMAVNPRGLGSWAEGSVDSPLEAYWAAYVISMSYTLSEVKSEASRFYQEFFGVKLSSTALMNIFGE